MAGFGALASTTALAKAPLSGIQVPFLYRTRVGEIEVTALSDGYFQAPLANFPSAEQEKAVELAAKVAIKLDRVPIPINALRGQHQGSSLPDRLAASAARSARRWDSFRAACGRRASSPSRSTPC